MIKEIDNIHISYQSVISINRYDAAIECNIRLNTTLTSIHNELNNNQPALSVNYNRAWIGLNEVSVGMMVHHMIIQIGKVVNFQLLMKIVLK